ncbi:MAG: hypothetical protein K0R18_865 [Bacillales bacterium]|nr:hypothetical protein [Bacillales bacterium]
METRRVDYAIKKVKFGGYDIKETEALLKELFNDLSQAEKVLSEKQEEYTNSYYLISKERDELSTQFNKCNNEYKKLEEIVVDLEAKMKMFKDKEMGYEQKLNEKEEHFSKIVQENKILKIEIEEIKENRLIQQENNDQAIGIIDPVLNQSESQLVEDEKKMAESKFEKEIDYITRENLELMNANAECLSDITLLKKKNDELNKINQIIKDENKNLIKILFEEQHLRKKNEMKQMLDTFEKEKKQRYTIDLVSSALNEMKRHFESLDESIKRTF